MSNPEENWKSNEYAYAVWFESHGNCDKLCWLTSVCVCVCVCVKDFKLTMWKFLIILIWNRCVNHEVYAPTLSYVEKKPSLEALWHKHTISLAI